MYGSSTFPKHSLPLQRYKSGVIPEQTPIHSSRQQGSLPRPFGASMPNIIGFDGMGLGSLENSRLTGYFPPRKPKSSQGTPRSRPSTRNQQISPDNTLVLETHLGVTSPRPQTEASSSASDIYQKRDNFRPRKSRAISRQGQVGFTARYTPDLTARVPDNFKFQKSTAEEKIISGDLSYLTKPKPLEPGRSSPWVYRYKIKRSMNNLSKIMASQPNSKAIGFRSAR